MTQKQELVAVYRQRREQVSYAVATETTFALSDDAGVPRDNIPPRAVPKPWRTTKRFFEIFHSRNPYWEGSIASKSGKV